VDVRAPHNNFEKKPMIPAEAGSYHIPPPQPAERLTMYEVSAKVNSPAYNGPEAVQRV
jgi:putative SOS response-associated peptidase YedK